MKLNNKKLGLPRYKVENDIDYRLCGRCHSYRLLEDFGKSSLNKDGLRSECKYCKNKFYKQENNKRDYHFNEHGQLKCNKCSLYYNEDNFYNDPNCKYRNFKGGECKNCQSKRKQKYRRINVEENLNKHLKSLLHGCNQRVKGNTKTGSVKGKEFNLNIEQLYNLYKKQNGKCAISGIEMTATIGVGRKNTNISIDRIDNNAGYTLDNIQLVCCIVNIMKNNISLEELVYFCNNIINHSNHEKNKE